jgi:uncharacterized protein (TIGR02646 family)
MSTFSRRRKPPDGKRHGWYKDCLRIDFQFRCAYCLIHEADYQGHESFQVDHFRPKSRFKDLERSYGNLYYACQLCNRQGRKGHAWPTPDEARRGERFVDPCAEDWEDHVEFIEDGSVRPLTPAGEYSIRTIELDRIQLRLHRRTFHREYSDRSLLRDVLRRLEKVYRLVRASTDLPREIVAELSALRQQVPSLEKSVRRAWNRKKAPPPQPRCPY